MSVFERVAKFFLVVGTFVGIGCAIGSILSVFLIATHAGSAGDVASRVSTMDVAADFESIDGDCTILSTEASSAYSFRYSQSSCSSQCYSASACSERRVHTFATPDGVSYEAAAEDVLLDASNQCAAERDMVAESARVGAKVPCWRATNPASLTRVGGLSSDPRYASYEGLAACGARCTINVGYRCGNTECVKIVDPAEERAFFAAYSSPQLPRLIGNAAIFISVLLLSFVGCYCYHTGGESCKRILGLGDDDDSSSEEGDAPEKKGRAVDPEA